MHYQTPASPGDDDIRVPYIDPEIITYLNLRYPNRLPKKGTPLEELDHLIGQRDVIDHLAELLKRQQDNALQA